MANLTEDNSTEVQKVNGENSSSVVDKIIEKKLEVAAKMKDIEETVISEKVEEKLTEKVEKENASKEDENTVVETAEQKEIKKNEETSIEEKPIEKVEEKLIEKVEEKPIEKIDTKTENEPVLVEEVGPKRGGRKKPVPVAEVIPRGRAGKRKAAEVEVEPEKVPEPVEEVVPEPEKVPEPVKEIVPEPVEEPAKPIVKKARKVPEVKETKKVEVTRSPIISKEDSKSKSTEAKVALLEAPLIIEGKRTRKSVSYVENSNTEVKEKTPAKATVDKKVVTPKKTPTKANSKVVDSKKKISGKKSKELVESEEENDDEPTEEPSEDQIRNTIKEIIDGANLDKITMKTVVKEVHNKYPGKDLSSKKNFIKNVVKELLE